MFGDLIEQKARDISERSTPKIKPITETGKTPEIKRSKKSKGRFRMNKIPIPGTNREINVPVVAPVLGAGLATIGILGGGTDVSSGVVSGSEGYLIQPAQADVSHKESNRARISIVDIHNLIDVSPPAYRKEAEESIPKVIEALHQVGIDSPKVIAYLLSTSEPESNLDLEKEEYEGRDQARKLGYDGGEDFFGRGFMPLTHKYNYRDMSIWLPKYFPQYKGIDLVANPDLAKKPDISAAIAAVYMKEKGVAAAVEAGDLDRARELVYGKITEKDDYGKKIKGVIDMRMNDYLKAMKIAEFTKSIDIQLDKLQTRK